MALLQVAVSQAEAAPAVAEAEAPKAAPAPAQQAPKAVEAPSGQTVIASPAARKLAREKGIDLTAVPVVDPLGRVRVQDVEAASKAPVQAAPAQTAAPKQAAAPAEVNDERIEVIKMTRRRQTIAKRLVQVQAEAAMLTTFNEVDLSAVMAVT